MHPLDVCFWTCLMLGGGYTLFTLLIGGVSHAAGHVGHALHLPHLDIDGHHLGAHPASGQAPAGHAHGGHLHLDHGHGHHANADSAHHHADHHAEAEEHGGVNILAYLNPMLVANFLFGFGGIGVLSRVLGLPAATSALFAATGGMAMWGAVYLLITRVFGAAEGTSHNRRYDVIGLRAQVTAPIQGRQPGMVSYIVSGARQTLCAVTDDEEPIPTGATVRIRRIENNTAYVMRIDAGENNSLLHHT